MEIATALTKYIGKNSAQAGVAIIKQATSAWPDGDPRKGSSKFQDVPPEYKAWTLQQLAV